MPLLAEAGSALIGALMQSDPGLATQEGWALWTTLINANPITMHDGAYPLLSSTGSAMLRWSRKDHPSAGGWVIDLTRVEPANAVVSDARNELTTAFVAGSVTAPGDVFETELAGLPIHLRADALRQACNTQLSDECLQRVVDGGLALEEPRLIAGVMARVVGHLGNRPWRTIISFVSEMGMPKHLEAETMASALGLHLKDPALLREVMAVFEQMDNTNGMGMYRAEVLRMLCATKRSAQAVDLLHHAVGQTPANGAAVLARFAALKWAPAARAELLANVKRLPETQARTRILEAFSSSEP
jgi:hypothetical protein